MPTTQEEAGKVLEICVRHKMTRDQMLGVFHDMHHEVGQPSSNESVKETMRMLWAGCASVVKDLPEPAPEPKLPPPETAYGPGFWYAAGVVVMCLHFAYAFASIIACILALCWAPWYLAFTAISHTVFLMSRRGQCLLTVVENYCRQRAGLPEIDSFMYHYFGRPVVQMFNDIMNRPSPV